MSFKKVRILQIVPELNVGGVETGTIDLARYLVQQGHHSVIISNGGQLVAQLEKDGSKHYQLPVHKKSLFSAFKCIKAVRQIIKKEDIDIVHVRSRVPAWIGFFACHKTRAGFVTTCHGYYSKHFFSRVMGWGKRVIVPSQIIGRHMIEDFGTPSENIRHIPRSVNLKRFRVPRKAKSGKSKYTIAIVGRITPLKGHKYFLQSMAQVVRSMPYVKIWVIGDTPKKKESYRQELEILVKRLGLTEHVEFLGNRNDIPELLSQTDALVLSTVTQEAFGRVIIEAQAAGVPVVATKVGGVVEIIDDQKTGLLVMPKDTEAMAQAVLKLLKDRKFAEELVREGQKKIRGQYTVEHMSSQTVKVYEEILGSLNILVIKLSSIGDVILISPSLKAIRKKFPNANIVGLVGEDSRKILQRCPYIDHLVVYDGKHKHRGWWRSIKFSKKLRRHHFDITIDFQNSRKSHLFSYLAFPRESYGFDNKKWSFLLSNRVKGYQRKIPPVEHQFLILKELGVSYNPKNNLEIWPAPQDQKYIQNLFDEEWLGNFKNVVGINIAASQKWTTKNWPVEYVAKLCDILASKNIRVLITGIDKDRPALKELNQLTKTKPASFIGKTDILQLAALIKRCRVYLTPDSAPLHVAAAIGVPTIAFFGPTSSKRHLPPGKNFHVFERSLHCAPCYSSRCKISTHDCMRSITPEEVAEKVEELMGVAV